MRNNELKLQSQWNKNDCVTKLKNTYILIKTYRDGALDRRRFALFMCNILEIFCFSNSLSSEKLVTSSTLQAKEKC
jgi:hypothetical protein